MGSINILVAFLGGLFTFFSPCVFPLIPGYIGIWAGSLTGEKPKPGRLILSTVLFVIGFTIVFTTLGLSAGLIGKIIQSVWVRISFGIIIIFFGLNMADILFIPFIKREQRPFLHIKSISPVKSFFMGLGFALGWSPCIGPILSSILMFTSTVGKTHLGILFLAVYSLGIGIPIILIAIFASFFIPLLKRIQKYIPIFQLVGGKMIAFLGFTLITGGLQMLSEVGIFSWNIIAGYLVIFLLFLIEIKILAIAYTWFISKDYGMNIPRWLSLLFFLDFIFYVLYWFSRKLIGI